MSGACRLAIMFVALALSGCGGHSATHGPDGGLLLRETGGVSGPGGGGRAGGASETDASTTALNHRLLEQAARPGGGGDLPVGAGDLLEVSVFQVEELSRIRVRVPYRGVIALPLLGQIQAAGRTTAELEDEIRSRLEKTFMHDPQISVFLLEHNSQRISVIGAVRKGGVFNLNRPLRLSDALALAEGVTEEADRHVYVIRRAPLGVVTSAAGGPAAGTSQAPPDGDTTAEVMAPIDLSELADGREGLNVALRSGDVVNVPRAGSIYVGGSVEKPGSLLLRGKTTIQQAIVAAGGVTAVADWGDVRLYRKTASGALEVTVYDLDAFEQGKPAPEVQRNDVVVVGKSAGKAFFYGFLDFFKGALGVAKGI